MGATTCQGAALNRVKRETIVGKMDKTFDFFGVHMGLKYKDSAQPLKGGKVQLKVDDLNFRKMDGIFNVAVEGTSLGEAVKGELKGSKKGDVQVFQFELEKGNKKYIQIETKIKMDCLNIEARTKYAVLGGTIAGKVLLKLENGVFNFKHTDSTSDESVELTAKYIDGKSLEIEGKKNGESMWTYKTNRTKR